MLGSHLLPSAPSPTVKTHFVAAGCDEEGSLLLNSDSSNEGGKDELSLCFVLNHLNSTLFILQLLSLCVLLLFLH